MPDMIHCTLAQVAQLDSAARLLRGTLRGERTVVKALALSATRTTAIFDGRLDRLIRLASNPTARP